MKLSTKILAVAFVVAIALTVTTVASAESFGRNLTIGSTGADVMALQQFLNANPATVVAVSGVGSAGMESSYFGGLTKAAVAKYQVAKGITPAVGYFGPITRAAVNAGGGAVVTPTGALCPNGNTLASNCSLAPNAQAVPLCPNGMTLASNCSTAPTGVVTPTNTEGSLSVTLSNAGLPSSVYEGNAKVGVLSFRVDAKNSDIAIQRIKVDLGVHTAVYNKRFSNIYVMDGSTVLASSPLNSETVVKDGTDYYITLAGMNSVVPRNGSKVYTIAVDVFPSVDTTYRAAAYDSIFSLPTDGIRGVDGAGVTQYTGTSAITRTVTTIATALVDSAAMTISLDAATPEAAQIVASGGSASNEYDKLPLLTFDLKATYDDVILTDLVATTTGSVVSGTQITTAYLFDGSTEIANASIGTTELSNITFSDILGSGLVVPKGTTKTLTLKADVRSAPVATAAVSVVASVTAVGFTAENSNGDTVTPTGSATGKTIAFSKSGGVITLLSKTTSKSTVNNTTLATATTTLTGTFVYRVTADGADVTFGTNASTSAGKFASTAMFVVYTDGAATAFATLPTISRVAYDIPDGVTCDATNTCTIADSNSADITVNVDIIGATQLGSHSYSIQTARLNLDGQSGIQTFMDTLSAWRTVAVTLP